MVREVVLTIFATQNTFIISSFTRLANIHNTPNGYSILVFGICKVLRNSALSIFKKTPTLATPVASTNDNLYNNISN
jgi:hypothetical protein